MKLIAALPVSIAFLAGALPAHAWTWPVSGPVLQPFSFNGDPYGAGQHRGIDVAAPSGTLVRAPAGGTVSFAGTVPRNGRTVTITTPDGFAATLVHLGSSTVARGDPVGEGETVGTVGPTGEPEHPEGYIHLGIRVAAEEHGYLDPAAFLPPAPVPTYPGEEEEPQPSEPEPAEEGTGSVPESPAVEQPVEPPAGELPGEEEPGDVPTQVPAEEQPGPAPSLPGVEVPSGLEDTPVTPAVPAVPGAGDVPRPSPLAQEADAWTEPLGTPAVSLPRMAVAHSPAGFEASPATEKGRRSSGLVPRAAPARAAPEVGPEPATAAPGVGARHETLGSGLGVMVAAGAIAILALGGSSFLRPSRRLALEPEVLDLSVVEESAAVHKDDDECDAFTTQLDAWLEGVLTPRGSCSFGLGLTDGRQTARGRGTRPSVVRPLTRPTAARGPVARSATGG